MGKRKSITERWETDRIPTSSVSQCSLCVHRHKGNTCDAYPIGIPIEFIHNKKIHDRSYKGDNGIIYSPIRDEYAYVKFVPFGKKKLY